MGRHALRALRSSSLTSTAFWDVHVPRLSAPSNSGSSCRRRGRVYDKQQQRRLNDQRHSSTLCSVSLTSSNHVASHGTLRRTTGRVDAHGCVSGAPVPAGRLCYAVWCHTPRTVLQRSVTMTVHGWDCCHGWLEETPTSRSYARRERHTLAPKCHNESMADCRWSNCGQKWYQQDQHTGHWHHGHRTSPQGPECHRASVSAR